MENIVNEKFYSVRNGQYFFKIIDEKDFYLLNNEFEWIYCPPLRDVYYDAASDYVEVSSEFIEKYISENKGEIKL